MSENSLCSLSMCQVHYTYTRAARCLKADIRLFSFADAKPSSRRLQTGRQAERERGATGTHSVWISAAGAIGTLPCPIGGPCCIEIRREHCSSHPFLVLLSARGVVVKMKLEVRMSQVRHT